MTDLIEEFNAESRRLGADLTVAVADAELRFTMRKLSERLLITPVFDVVLKLCKRYAGFSAIIDLSGCRIVSSIDLTFIGFVLTQTRVHGGRVRIICPSPINRRALAMVGFDGSAELVA